MTEALHHANTVARTSVVPQRNRVGDRLPVVRQDEVAHLVHHGDRESLDPACTGVLPQLAPQPGEDVPAQGTASPSRGRHADDTPLCRRSLTGFGISGSTAHAYTTAVVNLLAYRAPGLLKVLHEQDPDFVLLDGTLAECDRVGDGRPTTPTSTAGTG